MAYPTSWSAQYARRGHAVLSDYEQGQYDKKSETEMLLTSIAWSLVAIAHCLTEAARED